jgi:hypothetical protein
VEVDSPLDSGSKLGVIVAFCCCVLCCGCVVFFITLPPSVLVK